MAITKCIMCTRGKKGKGACVNACKTRLMLTSNPDFSEDSFAALFDKFGRFYLNTIFTRAIVLMGKNSREYKLKRLVAIKQALDWECQQWQIHPNGGPYTLVPRYIWVKFGLAAPPSDVDLNLAPEQVKAAFVLKLKKYFKSEISNKFLGNNSVQEMRRISEGLIWGAERWIAKPLKGPLSDVKTYSLNDPQPAAAPDPQPAAAPAAAPDPQPAAAPDPQAAEQAITITEGNQSNLKLFPPKPELLASNIRHHSKFTPLFSPENFVLSKAFFATVQSVRDALIVNWDATYDYYRKMNVKQVYYLSIEFLQGRAFLNAIGNLEHTREYAKALQQLGHNLEAVASQEPDAALGNGGLGRLASCFLDSLATLNYPAWGYGLRYKYGLFKQEITKDGQEEVPENWLEIGNPWEIVRNDVAYPIKFFGEVVTVTDGKRSWISGEDILAVAYDVPIPGYKTKTTISLRLWATKVPSNQFDLSAFNDGKHTKACEAQSNAEKICYILYPGDESEEGKILRLKQQYTLCSASIQDIVAQFERRSGGSVKWEELPDKVAVQMNDTHPTLCIPELMRILIDIKGLKWEEAWTITQRTVAYTNHTVLPEALEKWSYDLIQRLLPRHVEIIKMIDEQLIRLIVSEYGTSSPEILHKKLTAMRILENFDLPASVVEQFAKQEETGKDDSEEKKRPIMVRMANLCVVSCHAVNGVAEIHSEIVKEVFSDFYQLWHKKFQNKTNGVTPRRWIHFCNPQLSAVISKWIHTDNWVLKTEKLAELRKFVEDEDLHVEWRDAKKYNKCKVASFIKEKTGYSVNPDAMFDIQVKDIHESKRQLLNIMGIVYRYKKMKEMTVAEREAKFVPRVCIFGGKAFATNAQAKRIVKFIADVGAVINHDPDIGHLLKVIFVPNYNVSVAELFIPASDLAQHISTAGTEASGTSNMKFSMNGCILIGTLDGANVEIRKEVGEENFFVFGAQASEVAGLRKEIAEGKYVADPRFEEVKSFVRSGDLAVSNGNELIGYLEANGGFECADYFLVGRDFASYIECQERVDEAYRDQRRWTMMSIMNTAGSFKFSSDRTIHEYAKDIWSIKPLQIS